VLDLLGAKQRSVFRILYAIQKHRKRDDIPFEGLVFTQGGVIAYDRPMFIRAAKAQFDG
jgi:hypothetical protein